MKISTATRNISSSENLSDAIKLISEAGFDCLDISLFDLTESNNIFLQNNFKTYAEKLRKCADDNGVFFNQAHAPYSMDMRKYLAGGQLAENIVFLISRSIEVAAAVGAEKIVVHPIQCMDYRNANHREILEVNKEYYGRFAKIAIKNNIKIAIENMWRKNMYNGQIGQSVCSNPHELALYVDELNGLYGCFGACLDLGHCTLTGVDPANAITVLDKRLIALHVHDNDFVSDMHCLPLSQKIDYAPIMDALKKINYQGEFTLEANSFFGNVPTTLLPDALTFAAKVSRDLTKDI